MSKKVKKNIHEQCEFKYNILEADFYSARRYTEGLKQSYQKAAKEGSEKIEDLQHDLAVANGRISALTMSLVLMENHAKTMRKEINFVKRNPESVALAVRGGEQDQYAMRKPLDFKGK